MREQRLIDAGRAADACTVEAEAEAHSHSGQQEWLRDRAEARRLLGAALVRQWAGTTLSFHVLSGLEAAQLAIQPEDGDWSTELLTAYAAHGVIDRGERAWIVRVDARPPGQPSWDWRKEPEAAGLGDLAINAVVPSESLASSAPSCGEKIVTECPSVPRAPNAIDRFFSALTAPIAGMVEAEIGFLNVVADPRTADVMRSIAWAPVRFSVNLVGQTALPVAALPLTLPAAIILKPKPSEILHLLPSPDFGVSATLFPPTPPAATQWYQPDEMAIHSEPAAGPVSAVKPACRKFKVEGDCPRGHVWLQQLQYGFLDTDGMAYLFLSQADRPISGEARISIRVQKNRVSSRDCSFDSFELIVPIKPKPGKTVVEAIDGMTVELPATGWQQL